MIKIFILTFFLVFSIDLPASSIVDLYGDDSALSEIILKKYSKRVGEIESLFQEKIKKKLQNNDLDFSMGKVIEKKNKLIEEIKKEGGFLYVNFSTVLYPGSNNKYTTIEVVNKNQPDRLRFVTSEINVKNDNNKKDDLINQMIIFRNIEIILIINNKLNIKNMTCPVYHCISGFNHVKLKPYLKIFNDGAIKEKKLIIDTLNKDHNSERRAAAAFLIGHFNDPEEIISLLLPHINDNNNIVRNNVMRVIASTMSKAKIYHINMIPFLDLLDSPENTDRNKALYILSKAILSPFSKKNIIIKNGGNKLLALLRLKQPNNHDISYEILKKVSGRDFGDKNIDSWNKWLRSVQN
ncbi:hypothetical protein [Legionella oakridgensis]|uniref:HEAT repeat protein n=2 Tax=Legionella oakridgensis TaxID=29423 RepID=W0B6M9_9GAMM|nr:hypothetical protein [Legionella oakridgensis]AHE66203.1 hypothetical protein Loa_00634 [Legionella oakridgensis ATCC 33761 = DSM 21215]ETO93995.1 hypothetical protein LOR_6c00240 [Legionella oakridgensis RV-2-2007]KTD42328.1 hypothetical protein Loak_0754 [Legionella oakridgensis]STY16110.1 Uncharacterised protein [Legionella longbeachae]